MSESREAENGSNNTIAVSNDKWTAALERLHAEDRKRFELAITSRRTQKEVLSDVLEATNQKKDECMRKRWKVTVKGRTIILRDVLAKITTWVSKFATIGTAIAQFDPITTALPWAAIRLILQTSVNDVEIFGSVLQSVETISNLIATTAIHETLYLGENQRKLIIEERLSDSIVALYAAILQYLSDALHYYSNNTASRFMKSIGYSKAEFEEKFQPIDAAKEEVWESARLAETEKASWTLDSLDNISSDHQQQLADFLTQLRRPIDRISDQLSHIQDGLEREHRIQILRSISTVPFATHHKAARKGRLEGSGQWLLENKDFQAWRMDSMSSVLWLHGIPGSGKTKLASLVVDELIGTENMAYFYCMRNPAEPLRGQCDAILASLVRQLASTSAESAVLPPAVAMYQDALDGIEGFNDVTWESDESSRVLLELLEEYPSVTLVFDALDEVNPEDRQELMDILSELLRESPNLIKIFISSRENYDIVLHFGGSPNIYIDAQDNKGDIASFIDDRLTVAKLLRGRLTPALRDKITETLVNKARGMFRWVDLQIQSLRSLKLAADVEARLGVLPATLEESYWTIYQDIIDSGEYATDLATFTFQWVMYAKDTILARDFARFASVYLSGEDATQTFTEPEIIDVCANLVVNRSGALEFAHLSVREFLEGLPKREVDTFVAERSHSRIAAACLKDMIEQSATVKLLPSTPPVESENTSQEDAEGPKTTDEEETGETDAANKEVFERAEVVNGGEPGDTAVREEDDPRNSVTPELHIEVKITLEYPFSYWHYHTSESGEFRTETSFRTLMQEFMINEEEKSVAKPFRVWCQHMQSNRSFHLDRERLLDSSDLPPNPIWVACLSNWFDIIEYLYQVNYEGIEESRKLRSYTGRAIQPEQGKSMSPLWYAVATGNFRLAECILQLSPDPLQTRAQASSEPLVHAAEDGNEKLAALLLDKEHGGQLAEANALVGAARNGWVGICQMLIDHDEEILGMTGDSAFRGACEMGHLEVVILLVERGLSKEKMVQGLHLAAMNSHSEIIGELLRRDIGKAGMSKALITSVSNGDTASVTLLREFGAENEPAAVLRATREDTPLSALRLIEHGFPMQRLWPRTGQSPIHYASLYGRSEVVTAILGAGAVVNVYDRQGRTPLHLAALKGNTECVRILLDQKADVWAKDDDGKTHLDLAVDRNRTVCEALLRERMKEAGENGS